MPHYTLDARRLLCPMPVIRTQNRVAELAAGDELTVTATDPGVKLDIPAWCRINGHTVLAVEEESGTLTITLRVAAP